MSSALTFVCRTRMTNCVAAKGFVFVDGKSVAQEVVQIGMSGVKDEIFGPATPHFDLHATIRNPSVAAALREAFVEDYLHAEGSTGVEFRVTFELVGPSPPDSYP